MRLNPLIIALTTIILPLVVKAEHAVLPEVVIKGAKDQKPTDHVVKIKKRHIHTKVVKTSDTTKLLEDLPGVSIYSAGGISSLPVIHGMADDRVRTSVNGMNLTPACPNHMNSPLSYIDPTHVDEVHVHTGVTPVSVGGDSIGGSVIVQSAQPKFAEPGQKLLTSGELGTFYRSNGNAKGINAKAQTATDNYSITYTGSTVEAANYKAGGNFKMITATGRAGHTLSLKEVGASAYKAINHNLDFAMRNDNHLFDLQLGQQHIPYEGFPNQRMDLTDNQSEHANLSYRGMFQWGELSARIYHEETKHQMDFGEDKRFWYGKDSGGPTSLNGSQCAPISATCAAGMPMQTEGKTNGLAVKAEIFPNERDILRIGGEYIGFHLDDWWPPSGSGMWPGTFWNIKNGQRQRYALFGEWESDFAPNWTGLFGMRYELVKMNAGNALGYDPNSNGMGTSITNQKFDADNFNAKNHHKTDHNWDLSAILNYAINPALDFELGLARKTRSPNLYERYTWSGWTMAAVMNNFVGDGNGYFGDPDLKPEIAHTISTTLDWHDVSEKKRWEFKAAPYYTKITDYLDAVYCTSKMGMNTLCGLTNSPATNNFVRLQYKNQAARIYGVDFSGRTPLADTNFGNFGLTGLINYTRGRNLDTHDDLYNIMPLNTKLIITHKYGAWDNAIELIMVQKKNQISAVRNEIKTPSYELFNLRASYNWKSARLDLGIDNLFDKLYYLPLGGAYVGQGTTMSINGIPWGIAVPGAGRSVYMGVNFKF